MIYVVDYPNKWMKWEDSEILKRFNLLLSMIIYLCIESVLYTVILVIIEYFSYSSRQVGEGKIETDINDRKVLREIERANEEMNVKKENYSVRIKNLRKIYGSGGCSCNKKTTVAIKNMNFCVEPGECFGLLGLNGAGKTTAFKCITQEISPTNGAIYVNGIDTYNNFNQISSIIGYCPQYEAIFDYLTVEENLRFFARMKGVKLKYLDQLVKAMISEMALDKYAKKTVRRLSGGNKRKLSVAVSLLCNPQIILLDEPSTGMDPEARRFMWLIIHKTIKFGKKNSVIMTTHSMDEAETLCKRMGIMVNGEFVCLGKAFQIKERYGYGYEINIRIKPLNSKQLNEFIQILNKEQYDLLVQTVGEDIVRANYDQEPVDVKGKLYKRFLTYNPADIKTIDNREGRIVFKDIRAFADTADKGEDYLAMVIYGVTADRKAYVLDIYYTQDDMETTEIEAVVYGSKDISPFIN